MSIVEYLCKVSRARKKKAELFSETRLPQGRPELPPEEAGRRGINTRMVGASIPGFPRITSPWELENRSSSGGIDH